MNVVEAAPLEAFSLEVRLLRLPGLFALSIYLRMIQAVRANLQEAQRVANGNGSEEDKLEASIEAEVYEAIQHALA